MKKIVKTHIYGVTLIELMIVIVIISIIAAVAFPNYAKYVRKSKRIKAQTCLLEYSQYMERFRTANMRYDKDYDGNDHVLPELDCKTENGLDLAYVIGLETGSLKSREYKLQAVPQSDQVDDDCGTLSINHLGQKSTTKDATCW